MAGSPIHRAAISPTTSPIETARPFMETLVLEATGTEVVSLHHDISTVTGEEAILFALAEAPPVRERMPGSSPGSTRRTPFG